MKTEVYCGFGQQTTIQDVAVTDLQGAIPDRTQEHLGYADKAITAGRQMVFRALRELEAGREPAHVVRDGAANHFPMPVVLSEVFSSEVNWKTYCKKRIDEEEAMSAKGMGIPR